MPQLQPHIRLDHNYGARCALLPGDPARLDRIHLFLSDVEELAYNREYRSLVGNYQGVRVLALSTGIGGASAGIAMEELKNLGVKNMIRIGSCGALQPEVKIGDLVLVSGAVVEDQNRLREWNDYGQRLIARQLSLTGTAPDVAVIGMRVDARTRAAGELERFFATFDLPVLAYLRDTQVYVQATAAGMTLFDLPRSRAERDLEQWQAIIDWAEAG